MTRGKGLLGITLRYPYEVRNEKIFRRHHRTEYHKRYVESCNAHRWETGDFDPKKFEDQYDAVKELLKKKKHGEKSRFRKSAHRRRSSISWTRCAEVLKPRVALRVSQRPAPCNSEAEQKRKRAGQALVSDEQVKCGQSLFVNTTAIAFGGYWG